MILTDIDYCELHGISHGPETVLHEHHIKHRAAGGKDIRENVIKICGEGHTLCHTGQIKLWQQIEIVARREGKTPEEICEIIGLSVGKVLPRDYVFNSEGNPLQGMNLEDALQLYFLYEESEEQGLWGKAKIVTGFAESGMDEKQISSLVGCSPATVRERVRTYNAFRDETTRALDMSFTIHRICSKTDDPLRWLEIAIENAFSTRQLEEAIKTQGKGETIVKDLLMEKAERCIRMINEILEQPGEPSSWLYSELKIIVGEDSYEPKENICTSEDTADNHSKHDSIGV